MPSPLTSSHWGTYRVEMKDGEPVSLTAFEEDPTPSPIGNAIIDTRTGPCRIPQPMVRRGFLEKGVQSDRTLRGQDAFVPVDWDTALDMVGAELERVRDNFGHEGIYAGSYGWASAGRFHHAQSQLRRFMNMYGGCTTSRDSYSYAAAEVILPHIVGPMAELLETHTSWRSIAESGSLVVAFGGMASRNSQMNAGGAGRHSQPGDMRVARAAGIEFINIGPCQSDVSDELGAEWMPIRPNTDVALMLAIAHTLVSEGLQDQEFLDRYCVGFERFLSYLMGETDGQPKSASWAAPIVELEADRIVSLARKMATRPTFLNASWSLTRQQNGEQPIWMAVVLACMLGGIGKPGTGFGLGLGAVNGVGSDRAYLPWAALPAGKNPVGSFIPVARIADMLLNPGEKFHYNGGTYRYPDVRLVYWAGGNPYHHHQDLNRLRRAWRQIETVVVHDPFWTATARHADIVLPTTIALERNDLAASTRDSYLVAMNKVTEPYAMSRNDHDIFAGLASRLSACANTEKGFESEFRGGLDEAGWLRKLYDESRERGKKFNHDLPEFEEFLEGGSLCLEPPRDARVMLREFRNDPVYAPLKTPSGRIEIFSEVIAGFGLRDNPGHPVWQEPQEWLGAETADQYPLHLITHQPERRLHSQLDPSTHSHAGKVKGREPCRLNPEDAAARGIKDGDIVRLFNGRGRSISAAKLDKSVRPGVIMMATGAWYDPDWENDPECCRHGNPNVLTRDFPTSGIASGPSALSCLVEIERLDTDPPDVKIHMPPRLESSG
ncbi:MAG: Asp-tRNA(Asn)/Glu-tRNA(Gln) amidotransferase GatCAB subunit C [Sneathiella sp.]|uniref:molybdopterin guanine dinucleotide-containing S/N-oxide reductase n=1 Tax=Sneathiella sp. TaxID=1964365 RepID=UPI000C489A0A|nr:molybdopterin guanine dinucleotide-containing S/N-oxide reductase [Sneathiella sp.]MAZ03120.1 Asp-tRNA(Asn)/Glu-tRNA(Gln) amidotransferase GatCAB subunit C [Sneathiella sp.]